MSQLTVDIVARTSDVLKKIQGVTSEVERLASETQAAGAQTNVFQEALQGLQKQGIQTTAQLRAQLAQLVSLRQAFADDAAVVAQLDQRIEGLTRELTRLNPALASTATAAETAGAALNQAARASNVVGRSRGLNTQIWFQAGQAVSDFAIAGVRGAANNLEFLALQLGASAPLIIGLSVASAAFFTFGDDIVRALDPVGTKAKEIKDALSEVLTVVQDERPDLAILERQLPEAIEELQRKAEGLRSVIVSQQGGRDLGLSALLPGFFATDSQRQELADIEALIEKFQSDLEGIRREQLAYDASRRSSAIQENEAAANALRQRLEGLGLAEQAARLDNEALLRIIERGEEEKLIAELQEKRTRTQRQEVTELERAQEKLAEIRDELERRRTGELSVLDTVRDQTAELRTQIEVVKRLADERERQGGTLGIQGLSRIGAGPDATPQDTGSLIDSLNRAARERESRPRLEARGLDAGLLDSVTEQQRQQQEALREEFAATIELSEQLAASLTLGLADGLTTLAEAFGEAATSAQGFEGFGSTVLMALADLAGQVGKIAIGTGLAIAGIKKALESLNPIAAIAAGVALVGLSAAVKGRLSSLSTGGSGNASVIGGRTGGPAAGISVSDTAVTPAGTLTPAPSLQPLAPNVQPIIIEGELVGEGESLRAVIRNTDKRVALTRGVAG